MEKISFDRAVEYYDATRGYPEGTPERIRDAIVQYTGASEATRFLELGIGTGRIALPFIQAGFDYSGVDISQAMMDKLKEKLAGDPQHGEYRYQLYLGDVTRLPFANASFEVIIVVHVLHLIEQWQQAIEEARRVLSSGGWFLVAQDGGPTHEHVEEPRPARIVREKWSEIQHELGIEGSRKRRDMWQGTGLITRYLEESGATVENVMLVEHQLPALSARRMAEQIMARMYSSDWETPEDLHQESARRLTKWLNEECPEPDKLVSATAQFRAVAARWPG